jgi:uncharacterized membrane protein YcaP (DUF421 family)
LGVPATEAEPIDPDVTFLSNGLVPVLRVLFIAFSGYVTLLVLLRVSGQRTLAQMSAFDLVITVTLGSAFGRVLTAREVALVEVVAAFGALVLLQWLVANLWSRTGRLRRSVDVRPALLYYEGEVVHAAMRRHHLTEDDLHTAVRQEGGGSLAGVRAILLEGNGSFAVLSDERFGDGEALRGVAERQG